MKKKNNDDEIIEKGENNKQIYILDYFIIVIFFFQSLCCPFFFFFFLLIYIYIYSYIYIYIYILKRTHIYIYIYIFLLNTLSGGKSCSVAPGVAVPPWTTETVLSPWLAADEARVSHVLSHVVWWKKILKRTGSHLKLVIYAFDISYTPVLHVFLTFTSSSAGLND